MDLAFPIACTCSSVSWIMAVSFAGILPLLLWVRHVVCEPLLPETISPRQTPERWQGLLLFLRSVGVRRCATVSPYPNKSRIGWPVLRGREIPSLVKRDSKGTPSAW